MVATRSSLSNIINGFAPKVIHFKGVGIIGGSGFIGSYVTRKFLENGFQVRVSATDLANEDKYRHMRDLPQAEHLEIVPLNTLDAAALQSFVAGCDIVVHSGTPFELETENPQTDMFDPTVKGT
ncbi:MAG: NAD-dependent epimerase/dehydratase family protein [Saprospiraceae bacterium]|nr:NAD-dependent epimerase/dehydratase family protein [Saprospiraceae bacterium]